MTLLLSGKPCYITTDTRPTWSGNNGAMHRNGITMQTHRMLWGLKAPNPIPIGFMSNYIRKIYKCKILISIPCTTLKFLLGGAGSIKSERTTNNPHANAQGLFHWRLLKFLTNSSLTSPAKNFNSIRFILAPNRDFCIQ